MRGPLIKFIIVFSALLPLSISHWLGSMLGRLTYIFSNRHKQIAEVNIRLCYSHLNTQQQASLVRASLIELGKSVFEAGALWRWSKKRTLSLIKYVSDEALLDEALAKGNGVILAMPHLGAWELVGLYGSVRHPMTTLYQPSEMDDLNTLIRESRERMGANLVPTDPSGVKALYKALQENQLIAILPDQDPGDSGNVFAPFFGIPTNTMTLISRLAHKTQAEVLFCFAERLPRGAGFHLHISKAPSGISDKDPAIAAAALNEGLEQCIAVCPEQYQWSYKRFKNRPEGEAGYYE